LYRVVSGITAQESRPASVELMSRTRRVGRDIRSLSARGTSGRDTWSSSMSKLMRCPRTLQSHAYGDRGDACRATVGDLTRILSSRFRDRAGLTARLRP
jgi:hypothetical protein